MKPKIRTIPQFLPLYDDNHEFYNSRYKVFYGGRGGRKSWEFAQACIMRAIKEKTLVLCTREIQNSIGDSVHALLKNTIERLGVTGFFDIQKTAIYGQNGSESKFKGLNSQTIDSIKSFEGADIAWVEEAHSVSEKSWSILIPTIRKKGSELWIGFNPDMIDDPVYKRFITERPDSCYVQKVNYTDNVDCPETLIQEAEYLKKVDYDAYRHIYLGEVRNYSDAQVFKGKYTVESFKPDESFGLPLFGADWGFSVDPTTLVKIYIKDNKLYIAEEAYKVRCEIDDTASLFDRVEGAKKHVIRADNARPEIISYLIRSGYNMKSAEKWPGSIEDGTQFLRKFEQIIIHPSCKHAQEEFRLYSYKVDKRTQDVLPQLEDKHNHVIDALRYAIEPLIKGKQIQYRPGQNSSLIPV